MRAEILKEPQKYIVADDFLDGLLLEAVTAELLALRPHLEAGTVLRDGAVTGGSAKKQNRNLWLDDHYQGRRTESALLRAFQERFWGPEMKSILEQTGDQLFANAIYANADCTLVSVYGPGDFYMDHQDEYPSITVNLLMCAEPKAFTGGDFYLADNSPFHPDRERTYTRVECRNNRLVVFPGRAYHYVDALHAPADLPFEQQRFSVQYWPQFVTVRA